MGQAGGGLHVCSNPTYIRRMVPWRNSVPRKRAALAPASFIDPCLPTRTERAPVADGWVHEIKHDGFRLQIHVRGKRVGLYTMTGVDWTARYPWIVEDVARLNLRHGIFDAECCCDSDKGIPDFERLMARVNDASAYAYAFDLLTVDDKDMRSQPLADRKAALAKLLRKAKPGVRYSEHLSGDGRIVFDQACKLGFEGIVSKRLDSAYRSGKVKTWLKVKNPKAAAMVRIQEGLLT
jgi:bifunctional non-homologous end joining protein LigD